MVQTSGIGDRVRYPVSRPNHESETAKRSGVVGVLGDSAERFVPEPDVAQEEDFARPGGRGSERFPAHVRIQLTHHFRSDLAYTTRLPRRSPSFHPLTYRAQMPPPASTFLSKPWSGDTEG